MPSPPEDVFASLVALQWTLGRAAWYLVCMPKPAGVTMDTNRSAA
jgi:hypothetical protein